MIRLEVAASTFLCLWLCIAAAALGSDRVRPSALAGGWYPADPVALAALVDGMLDAVGWEAGDSVSIDPVRALILPHAGYQFSGATAAEAIARVSGARFKRVLILAPSHYSGYLGLSIADVGAYRTPLGAVPLDSEAVARLRQSDLVDAHPEAHRREHSIEIQLPFLQRALAPGWRLVPVLVGQLDETQYPAAAALLRPLADAQTLVIASSDFTHYGRRFGYQPFPLDSRTAERLRALDEGALDRIRHIDASGLLAYQLDTGITVCGIRPLALLVSMLPPSAKVRLIGYETSGALTGDYRHSVSYAALAITTAQPIDQAGLGQAEPRDIPTNGESVPQSTLDTATSRRPATLETGELALLHRFALFGIDQAVLGNSIASEARLRTLVEALPETLTHPGRAFVTLRRGEALRGCIGTLGSHRPLFLAVLENGFKAAGRDRRFRPVAPEELAGLTVEVSVLTPPRPIGSPAHLRLGEQGVILSKAGHRALFLPEVAAQQGWDREQTLDHLALKAGLPAEAWREGATFEVFESIRYAAPYAGAEGLADRVPPRAR